MSFKKGVTLQQRPDTYCGGRRGGVCPSDEGLLYRKTRCNRCTLSQNSKANVRRKPFPLPLLFLNSKLYAGSLTLYGEYLVPLTWTRYICAEITRLKFNPKVSDKI